MLADKLGMLDIRKRKVVVVAGGEDERRAGSEEREVETPNIFEGSAKTEKVVGADESAVEESPAIERDNELGTSVFNNYSRLGGKDIEEANVGKDRNDVGIDVQVTLRESKGGEERAR